MIEGVLYLYKCLKNLDFDITRRILNYEWMKLSRPEIIGPGWMSKKEFFRLSLDEIEEIKEIANQLTEEFKEESSE